MHSEANRLRTFQEWPSSSPVSPSRIAKAGFFYTGEAQVVKCFLCHTTISEWDFGDQVMARHQLANPECPFVLDPNTVYNIPLYASTTRINSRPPDTIDPNLSQNNDSDIPNPMRTDLKKYSNRLHTFENWPIPTIVSPERLAKSGFYYLQQTDTVECVYCEGVLAIWEPGDDPDREHRIQFPNCDFHLRVAEEEDDDLSAEKVELGNVKLMPGTTSDFTELGIQHHSAPRQPKHATYEGRLRTFQGWPSNLKQTPEMLADAGFYYVGSLDQVRCFHCDGGLRNWEETDDTWIEHAKWFPKCGYVALVKGQDFIKQCVEKRPPVDPAILASVPDDNDVLNITPPLSPTSAVPQQPIRRITDADLEGLLGTAPAVTALEIGLHVGRVKMALKRRMEQTGLPYANADQLIEDATQIQLNEEGNSRQRSDSPSVDFPELWNYLVAAAESASESQAQTESMLNDERKSSNVVDKKSSTQDDLDNKIKTKEKDSKTDKPVSLEEENRRLREARLCKICMDRDVTVVFLPCGHLSTCVFCAPSLTQCPICRQEIRATVRTFLA